MTHSDAHVHSYAVDPRAAALAAYLRQRAAAFSRSADVIDSSTTPRVGIALLDAALIAHAMAADDPRITALSEAGRFESMPGGTARFVETAAVRAAFQRPIVGPAQDGGAILALLVATATAPDPPTDPRVHVTTALGRRHPMPYRLAQRRVELARARSFAALRRQGPQVANGDARAAAAKLLACLEAYVAEMLAQHLPVPPALRDELRLRRRLR
ncbi:MAG TPA: hypothetical protein VFT75_04990 [Nocardioidaceae bacterium]|jgi:hypothetical protein|nr:hypothetical protein [Nocardioidaceae bacterium]